MKLKEAQSVSTHRICPKCKTPTVYKKNLSDNKVFFSCAKEGCTHYWTEESLETVDVKDFAGFAIYIDFKTMELVESIRCKDDGNSQD